NVDVVQRILHLIVNKTRPAEGFLNLLSRVATVFAVTHALSGSQSLFIPVDVHTIQGIFDGLVLVAFIAQQINEIRRTVVGIPGVEAFLYGRKRLVFRAAVWQYELSRVRALNPQVVSI